MAVEEERTELILQETKTDQPSDISKGVQSGVTRTRHSGRVEASLAGLVEEWSVLVTEVYIHPLRSVPQCCLAGQDGGGGGDGRYGGGQRSWRRCDGEGGGVVGGEIEDVQR